MTDQFSIGSLIRARGREWVVLPGSTEKLLLARPLGGNEDETSGILRAIEPVESAIFPLPNPEIVGDYRSARLLRDAIRLGFRSSAGPFRSFGRINVEPRPYQLVPLMMALKLDPVRLLIADDVGIGKTIEALLIARELLDRGEIKRLAILCPPHLAEQWQKELASKFHIDAELVLSSTATRLERNVRLRLNESLFDHYPYVIVSTDFIKSEQRRDDFARHCPEFVIVDEAHTVAHATERRTGRHRRYELISALAENPDRHIVLVTATPHSGDEDAFRSLLTLLNPDLADLPLDLSGTHNEAKRRELARYFVQRRRDDLTRLDEQLYASTPFPDREYLNDEDHPLHDLCTHTLTPEYRQLFQRALDYARKVVRTSDATYRQRVRWWSALALLRSLASSPAAAAATLKSRAATAAAETDEDVEAIGVRTVLDVMADEATEGIDVIPGSDFTDPDLDTADRRSLRELEREAKQLLERGIEIDNKLKQLVALVRQMVKDGYHPIIFCRFIPTVDYVVNALREALSRVEIIGVTGLLPPDERETRVRALASAERRILVCTDCLSEGINLQEGFDAVIHYDLSWNPTRHEQREGRVDRYGQYKPVVRVATCYGIDNQIDGIVLDVLLRKHQKIRSTLGISVPIPADTSLVIDAIFEGLLLKEDSGIDAQFLPGFEEFMKPQRSDIEKRWDIAVERERRNRTVFAQEAIKPAEVFAELTAMQNAIGAGVDVTRFMRDAVTLHGGVVELGLEADRFDLTETPRALKERYEKPIFTARYSLPVGDKEVYLTRTSPLVEALATYTLDTALDANLDGKARRSGAIRTRGVERRTTLLIVRFRFHLITRLGKEQRPLLAEDCTLLAFEGAPDNAVWLDSNAADRLLTLEPDENVPPEMASEFVRRVVDGFDALRPALESAAAERGAALLDAHRRVREASRRHARDAGRSRLTYDIQAQTAPDVLGIYVFLPARKA